MKNSFYKKAIEKVVENMNCQLQNHKDSCKKGKFVFEIGEGKLIEREDSYMPRLVCLYTIQLMIKVFHMD